MRGETITLAVYNFQYYSQYDEDAFFEWLDKIDGLLNYRGDGEYLYINISNKCIDDNSLRELIALFFRYGIDMKQLSVFKNDNNQRWFFDSQKYWFGKVFSG